MRLIRTAVAALALETLAAVGTACGEEDTAGPKAGSDHLPDKLAGVELDPAPDVTDATLPRADDGSAFSFVPEAGDVQLVYFGYTACPDICPTTLSDLRNALKSIGKTAAGHVRVAMATIDPRRDSSVVLSGYLQSFFGDGVALRTDDDAQLQAAATAFGATYEAKYPNQGEPQVSHSTYLYAVDHTGHVVVAWPFGTTAADMAHDLELLLHREKEGAQ